MHSHEKNNIDVFPEGLKFSVFFGEDIKRLSAVKIITGLTFDPLGHPLPGGLYDNRMGTTRKFETCATCQNIQTCPGHLGHIELNALVYNPFFVKVVQRILSMFCFHCYKMQMKYHVTEIVKLQLKLINAGYIIEAQELEIFKSEAVCQSADTMAKLENGDLTHPRVAEIVELLAKADVPHIEDTKTSCALRASIINATLQRSSCKKCIWCEKQLRAVRYTNRKLVYYISAAEMKNRNPDSLESVGQNKAIFADECRKLLRNIYANDAELLRLLFPIIEVAASTENSKTCPVDLFFMDTIAVIPPQSRPANVLREQIVEHAQTTIYRGIIENNAVVQVILRHLQGQQENLSEEALQVFQTTKGDSAHEKFYNAWQALQTSVDLLLDVDITKDGPTTHGLKQILEKKDGLIRKHMMGKRVNFAARTVITPDPNIDVDEIGIPDIFARKLTYPTPVTPYNVTQLRKMIINGPNVHPGANYIQEENGRTTLIPADDPVKRLSMAKLLYTYPENGIRTVHRHMLNGDVLLLNRQPSLHKPSIMAHKARILPKEKTFRLHYSNCKSYNADFDGDEMNAHYPQNEVARSEAYNLVSVTKNYLVPKDGTPLGGLIQDHVISGVKLSIRGRFFNREDYHQLVYQGLSHIKGDIKLLPPTILKPIRLWSGKQILSTIIINIIPEGVHRINLHSFAKIASKQWIAKTPRIPKCGTDFKEELLSESQVIIHKGELLAGVLDKQQYGATNYGLIHSMYELYGGEVSTRLLTAFTKLFTYFLQREGFTLGVQDILVTPEADKKRRKIIRECRKSGILAVANALNLNEDDAPLDVVTKEMEEAYIKDPKFRVVLDRKYKFLLDNYTNDINKTCLPNGLVSRFPDNNLQLMVLSGAKGSMVNTMQISCLLGQIELEGKRPPLMISGKSLPSFPAFEMSPKSGGFIDGRFMTGIQPQDFFFHCMAGREGLIDTAVKTSRSGYLQRCLIKHLEGLTVAYDLTVRDSDRSVVQFLYGEDGLDILKSTFFNRVKELEFLSHNAPAILAADELHAIKNENTLHQIKKHVKKIKHWQKKHKDRKHAPSGFTEFSAELRHEVDVDNPEEINPNTGRRKLDESILKLWKKADQESKDLYHKKHAKCPDTVASAYKQDTHFGATSEKMEKMIEAYQKQHKDQSSEYVADIMYLKNIKALAAPGEPVGLLAAQSIGEPSTQMTLNTFHFAGRGEMNVTLGIPRLREILMMASANIKTPSIDVPIKEGQAEKAEKLRIQLNRVTLANILQYVNVKMRLVQQPELAYRYTLHFQFLPRHVYADDYCVRPKQVLKYMSNTFFNQLFRVIIRSSKQVQSAIEIEDKKPKGKNKEKEDDENIDNNEMNGDILPTAEQNNMANDNNEDSSDNEDNENDTAGIKLKLRKQDEKDYDEPDDAEEIDDANVDDDDVLLLEQFAETYMTEADSMENDAMIDRVMGNQMVTSYTYDKKHHLWCELTFDLSVRHKKPNLTSMLRHLAEKSVIHEVPNIKRAIIYTGEHNVQYLKTDGYNIIEMFKHDKILDLNRLYSNDIHAIAKTYGIEAATQVIMKEVTNVFKVYGITVNRRHLSLIADYMTFSGDFQPMSRRGMDHSASPLQQISFESCLKFLKDATSLGQADNLNSPSSRLIVGLPVENGTGAFQMIAKQINTRVN